MEQKYTFEIYNGRIKIKFEGCVMFSFNQIDLLSYYFFKDDSSLYGCTIHFLREKAGHGEMDVYFKSKETWLAVNKLLDQNL
jgi:hypothetical protein